MKINFVGDTIKVQNYGMVFFPYRTVRKSKHGYGTKSRYGKATRYGVRKNIPYRTVQPALDMRPIQHLLYS